MAKSVALVALLRGVNIGGKRVEMARLRSLLAQMGYEDVRTYVQSGNAVLRCAPKQLRSIATDIEEAIAAEFALSTRVVIRTADELAGAIAADPLLPLMDNPSRHLVCFLSEEPDKKLASTLEEVDYGSDRMSIVGRHMYLWCPDGVSASPFFKIDFDRKLGVVVTNRNWNTVLKLAEMVGS